MLDGLFASRQDALDGFLGAAHAVHTVARIAVMADAADLQKAVGSGDGAWFAAADARGRGQMRMVGDEAMPDDGQGAFTPTLHLYDNYPGGVGLSEPLWTRQAELLRRAIDLIDGCDCIAGCPACVGPVLPSDEAARDATPKAHARRVLAALSAVDAPG